jgi:thiol:disulfide interchange protein DsbD
MQSLLRAFWSLTGFLVLFACGPNAVASADSFSAIASAQPVQVGSQGEVIVSFRVPTGSVLYADAMDVRVLKAGRLTVGALEKPEPEWKIDPAQGNLRAVYSHDVSWSLPIKGRHAGTHELVVEAQWQGCKGTLCTMLKTQALPVQVQVTAATGFRLERAPVWSLFINNAQAQTPSTTPDVGNASVPTEAFEASPTGFAAAQEKGVGWLLVFVFGAGFLVSLTPCVLPMVPITMGIIGASAGGSRSKGLALGATYVVGQALVYTVLGVSAAMAGSVFGAWMQSIWVVGGVAGFFFLMGLSMFGFFNVQVPATLQTKLSNVGGAGFVGAFLVGMVGALVAGPCSGPVIASLMVLIGQKGEMFLGISLMLSFSLGMGVIFLLAGAFSTSVLRPGAWMDTVKKGFGVILWLGAIFFASAHLSQTVMALSTCFVLLSTAVWGWPSRTEDDLSNSVKVRRLYSVFAGMVGSYLLLGLLISRGFILGPAQFSGVATAESVHVAWQSDDAAVLAAAKLSNKPIIVDFTANWCAPCKKMERTTFSDPGVVALSEQFELLQIDGTKGSEALDRLKGRFGALGFPTVAFVRPDGTPMAAFKLESYEAAAPFMKRMQAALVAVGGEVEAQVEPGPEATVDPIQVAIRSEGDRVLVEFTQQEGWHLTQSMTFLELAADQSVTLGEQSWPEAHQRPDPAFPPEDGVLRGELDGNFTAFGVVEGAEGTHKVKGTVGYQACRAERCLLPVYVDFELDVVLTQ